jgi:hypothetical protein
MTMPYQMGLAYLPCSARRRRGASRNDQNKTRSTRRKLLIQSVTSVLSSSTLKVDARPQKSASHRGGASLATRANQPLGVKQAKWISNLAPTDVRVRTPQVAEPVNNCWVA